MIGVHTVMATPIGGGAPVDISCLVDTVGIVHGRDDTTKQPDASTATLDLSFDTTTDDLPAGVDIGADLVVTTTVAGTVSDRFTGKVTDLVAGWEEAGEDTPNNAVMQIIGAGPLADLRSNVGDVAYPQELDGARVARVLAAAGVVLNPATSDPGTVQILARDIDPKRALGLAQGVAANGSGVLWQTRDGEIRYADAEHRRGTTPAVTLDACDVLVTPTWRRDTSGLINGVDIGYGLAPEGGEQPRYVNIAPTSKARYGDFDLPPLSTELAALADAQALGNLLLSRNASPVWLLQELPVDLVDLDEARTLLVLALDIHDLVGVTGLPVIGALPSHTSLWVEGWSETLAAGVHDVSLFVSGYCRTTPPPRWEDVDPALTWNAVPASMTWDSAACMGPLPNLGRWDDTPASLRWNAVPPEVTWNTWDAYIHESEPV